jgi:hypothetical protein
MAARLIALLAFVLVCTPFASATTNWCDSCSSGAFCDLTKWTNGSQIAGLFRVDAAVNVNAVINAHGGLLNLPYIITVDATLKAIASLELGGLGSKPTLDVVGASTVLVIDRLVLKAGATLKIRAGAKVQINTLIIDCDATQVNIDIDASAVLDVKVALNVNAGSLLLTGLGSLCLDANVNLHVEVGCSLVVAIKVELALITCTGAGSLVIATKGLVVVSANLRVDLAIVVMGGRLELKANLDCLSIDIRTGSLLCGDGVILKVALNLLVGVGAKVEVHGLLTVDGRISLALSAVLEVKAFLGGKIVCGSLLVNLGATVRLDGCSSLAVCVEVVGLLTVRGSVEALLPVALSAGADLNLIKCGSLDGTVSVSVSIRSGCGLSLKVGLYVSIVTPTLIKLGCPSCSA